MIISNRVATNHALGMYGKIKKFDKIHKMFMFISYNISRISVGECENEIKEECKDRVNRDLRFINSFCSLYYIEFT